MKDFRTSVVVTDNLDDDFYCVHVFRNRLYKGAYKISKELYPTIDTMIDRIERQYRSVFFISVDMDEDMKEYRFVRLE